MAIFVSKNETVERATLLRELLLRRALKTRENPNRDYTAALDSLTDDLVVTDTNGVLTVDLRNALGEHDDTRHNIVAAARCIMAGLETAPNRTATKSDIVAHEAPRGFTAPMVNAALSWLVEQRLITVTAGTVTDISGDRRPSGARPALPEHLVTPRTAGTTAPQTAAPQTVSTAPSTTAADRVRMDDASALDAHVPDDPLAMGRRMQSDVGDIPNLSFDPGDLSLAPPPSVKKVEKKSEPTIPDSALTAYIESVLTMWARHGKLTATWGELPWVIPDIDLPEGVTHDDVANAAFTTLKKNGTIAHADGVYTFVPARDAVGYATARLIDKAPTWDADVRATIEWLAATASAQRETPNGWAPEVIARLALDAATTAGALVRESDGVYFSANPKVEPEVVTPAPAKSGVPETNPATSAPVAGASGTPSPSPKTSGTTTPKAAPTGTTPALEKKVDALGTAIDRVERKLHTLPAPPSPGEVLVSEADEDVKMLLQSVCVHLKARGAMRESPLHRALPGKAKPSRRTPNPIDRRLRLGEALTLGVDAGVLAHDPLTRTYRLVTATPVMSRTALDRRVQRLQDAATNAA